MTNLYFYQIGYTMNNIKIHVHESKTNTRKAILRGDIALNNTLFLPWALQYILILSAYDTAPARKKVLLTFVHLRT